MKEIKLNTGVKVIQTLEKGVIKIKVIEPKKIYKS